MCQSRPPLLLLPSIHTNTQLWLRSVSPWQPIPRTESSAGPFRLKGFGCEAESLYNGTRADAEQHRGALVERIRGTSDRSCHGALYLKDLPQLGCGTPSFWSCCSGTEG
uniref:Uncharacterized protein n=1 Tax=Nothobranchius kadleci TaxID=1051664 RepID=A0A1A8D7L4_NOTKA